jgi:organic radical activating enzyme
MSKLKVSEIFYSAQGEGRFIGVPSVFLRTFGCNFTCGGFGMKDRTQMSTEREFIDPTQYRIYEELPLVNTGCDSYASWDPRFKNFSPLLTIDAVVQRMLDLVPSNSWIMPNGNDTHLVITGGEPLLGWQRAYPDLLNHEKMLKLKEITFETNGTQKLTPEFKEFLKQWGTNPPFTSREITFSVSAKLPCSGEKWEDAICPEIVCEYESVGTTYLKFVIATEQDFADAECAIAAFRSAGFKGHVYLMPVGGVESVYSLNNKAVAIMAMNAGLRYSDRLQVPLFKNEWGT